MLVHWAKLEKGGDGGVSYHPLICHMLDVAAVTTAIWDDALSRAARAWFTSGLGLGEEKTARTWVCFLAGTHDLGKASPAFQLQDAAAPLRARLAGFPSSPAGQRAPHGMVTAIALAGGALRISDENILAASFGFAPGAASTLACVLGGHHGVIPSVSDLKALHPSAVGGKRWRTARAELAGALADVLEVDPGSAPSSAAIPAALVLGGYVSVADWIGSNVHYFPFRDPSLMGDGFGSLAAYWSDRRQRAHAALDRLGWTGWKPPVKPTTFQALFPDIVPHPVQHELAKLAGSLEGPALVVVEAPTGEGKTEAAFYGADHWAAGSEARGFFLGLPTQATSDQMFGRAARVLEHRYPSDIVNLQLLHGHAALSAEFAVLRANANQLFAPVGIWDEEQHDAGVVAAEWFTHRKRGLLAPFGVGTIDQALLAALRSRHVFVRLFGLARKVVIIDEVHAYDTYMTSLLERLLEWLGALESPVMLLSATLPAAKREALLRAYGKGLGVVPEKSLAVAYPRVSWVSRTGTRAEGVQPAQRSRRRIVIRWIEGGDEASAHRSLAAQLAAALEDGGCAAVVCNTVGRAQSVYRALREHFPAETPDGLPLDLLHSRFTFAARDEREQRVVRRFGKNVENAGARPRRAVLVATQVIEQSLDLDFDLMVTDLAPIDLILQRVGRLHRHERPRPERLREPEVWIRGPAPQGDLPSFPRGDQHIYDAHVLLRSWLALRDRTCITAPNDVESLIESVYHESPPPAGLNEELARLWSDSAAKQHASLERERDEASRRWIKPPWFAGPISQVMEDPRAEEDAAEDLHPAHVALTRLAEPSVSVVCLFGTEGAATPTPAGPSVRLTDVPDGDLVQRLLRQSVRLGGWGLFRALKDLPTPRAWAASALLRNHRALVFDGERRARVGESTLTLDDELGIVITRGEE